MLPTHIFFRAVPAIIVHAVKLESLDTAAVSEMRNVPCPSRPCGHLGRLPPLLLPQQSTTEDSMSHVQAAAPGITNCYWLTRPRPHRRQGHSPTASTTSSPSVHLAAPSRVHPRTTSGSQFRSRHGRTHPALQPIIGPFSLSTRKSQARITGMPWKLTDPGGCQWAGGS